MTRNRRPEIRVLLAPSTRISHSFPRWERAFQIANAHTTIRRLSMGRSGRPPVAHFLARMDHAGTRAIRFPSVVGRGDRDWIAGESLLRAVAAVRGAAGGVCAA